MPDASEDTKGVVERATDAEAAAGTDTTRYITAKQLGDNAPATALASAWVNFNGTGTVAIRDSYNVSSITDDGTGRYTVNFTNDFANTDYAGVVSAGDPDINAFNVYGGFPGNSAPTVSAGSVYTHSDNNSVIDSEYVSAIFYGELA